MITASRTKTERPRRQQILAAARRVFAEKGYDGATVADIVAAAGVAQGTFYLYFSSKEAVVIELANIHLSKVAEAIMAAYEPARPLAESIRTMIHAAFEVASENRDLARLVRFTLDVGKVEAAEATRHREAMVSAVAGILAQRMETGELNPIDPEIAARLINGLVRDACHACFVFGDGSEAKRYEDTVVALLSHALIKKR